MMQRFFVVFPAAVVSKLRIDADADADAKEEQPKVSIDIEKASSPVNVDVAVSRHADQPNATASVPVVQDQAPANPARE